MFDCNIHLPCKEKELDDLWSDERGMGEKELLECFEQHRQTLQDKIYAGNFMLFNENLKAREALSFTSVVRNTFAYARFTVLLNIHNPKESERLLSLKNSGIDAVKFHCYFQKIEKKDFSRVMELSKVAASLNMPIFIDTSYGSAGMYSFDNLRLAAFLLKEITDVPVVLLHSGGARILEAFLLAASCPNVFLETSFSLPYYIGSSVEQDMAFAYKKVSDKVIYGSDFPYVDMTNSLEIFLKFTQDWKFTDVQIEGFLSSNIDRVFIG